MQMRSLALSLLSCAIFSALFPAAAEQNQTSTTAQEQTEALEHIEVNHAVSYRSTATKSTLLAQDTPVTIKVIDWDLLNLRQADSINKALRYVAGVTSESRATVSIFDQYNIRGFDVYQSFYDGLPLLSNNQWNLYPQVDAFATEAVEVLKGPASSLYGLVPPGGMVNQIAKAPESDTTRNLRAKVGTDNLYELGLDFTGSVSNDVNYRFVGLARNRDGQQRTTETERVTIAPSIGWQINDQTHLTASLYYQDDPKAVPSTPLPGVGTLYEAPYGKLDADMYAGDQNWGNFDRTFTLYGLKLHHDFGNGWTLLNNLRYTDAEGLQRNSYNFGLLEDQTTLVRTFYMTDETIDGITVDNQLAGQVSLGQSQHNLLFGVDYQRSDSDVFYADTFGVDSPLLNLANPDFNQVDPNTLPITYYNQSSDIEQKQLGFYVQDEISLGRFTFVLNLRYDQFDSTDTTHTEFAGTPTPGTPVTIDQSETSGRIAALYKLDNGVRVYANYAESFEPVSGIDSLTGQAFDPTTADQVEAGFKYLSDDKRIAVNAAYFVLTKQNVVVNTADFLSRTQTGEVESKGIEIDAHAELTDDFIVTATYSDLSIENTQNELNPALVGKTPVWVADKTASVWANYHTSDNLMLGAGVRYVGESQLDALNTDTVPSYTLVDLVGRYTLGKDIAGTSDIDLTLSVSNLTDKRYVGACFDVSNCWMGAERMIEAGVQASF